MRRLSRVVRSSVGALLAPADDPRPAFAHACQRQRELLERVRLALAELGAAWAHIVLRQQGLDQLLPVLDEQARSALLAGRDDDARSVLRRRAHAAAHALALADEAAGVAREEQSLRLIEQRLANQLDSFAARRQVLTARLNTAEAQVRIDEALTGLAQELGDLGLALEGLEESAQAMRARASALEELAADGVLPGLPAEPAVPDTEVEALLAEIRTQLRPG